MVSNDTFTCLTLSTASNDALDAILIFDGALTPHSRDELAEVMQFENERDLRIVNRQAHFDLFTVLAHLDDSHDWQCSTMLHVHFPSEELAKHQLFHARLALSTLLRAYRYDEELISNELAEIAELAGSSLDTGNYALHFHDTARHIAINLPTLLDSDASRSFMVAANALANSISNNNHHIINGINSVLDKLSIK